MYVGPCAACVGVPVVCMCNVVCGAPAPSSMDTMCAMCAVWILWIVDSLSSCSRRKKQATHVALFAR